MTREEAVKWLSNLKNDLGQMQYQPLWHYAEAIDGIIEELQTDIVRCGECKWADWYKTADGEQFCYCMETGNGGRTADDFCSYGEREK